MQDEYVTYDPRIPKHKTYLTSFLIVLIISMYFIEVSLNAVYSDKTLIVLGAKWNEGIRNGEYWRFLSSTLLHGNLFHLFVNLAAIYIFGKEVESIFGTFRYLLVYLISSWGAGLLSFTLSQGISIGASGAIFGIIGALVIFFYRQQEKLSGAKLKFKSMYTLVIINLLFGFMIPRIDNAGHIGGLLSGVISSWFIAPEYKIQKDENYQKLIIIKKPDSIRLISGLMVVSSILFFLTIQATGKRLFFSEFF